MNVEVFHLDNSNLIMSALIEPTRTIVNSDLTSYKTHFTKLQ